MCLQDKNKKLKVILPLSLPPSLISRHPLTKWHFVILTEEGALELGILFTIPNCQPCPQNADTSSLSIQSY